MSKDDILKVAAELFIRHGYHGVTTRMLARETSLSVGTIYHHFSDKKQLFYETLVYYVKKDPLLHSDVQSIEELFRYLIEHRQYYQSQTRLLIETRQIYSRIDDVLNDPAFLDVRQRLLSTYLGWIKSFILKVYHAVPEEDAETLAQIIFHSSSGIFQASLFNPKLDLRKLLLTVLDIITTYLSKLNEKNQKMVLSSDTSE